MVELTISDKQQKGQNGLKVEIIDTLDQASIELADKEVLCCSPNTITYFLNVEVP